MTFFRLLYKKTLSSSLKQKRKAAKQVKGKYYVLFGRHFHGCLASSCALISEKTTTTRTGVGQNDGKISRKEKNIIMETHFCLAQFILFVLRPFPSLKLFFLPFTFLFFFATACFQLELARRRNDDDDDVDGKVENPRVASFHRCCFFDATESPFRHFKISTSNRTFVPAAHAHLLIELLVVVVIFSFQTPRRLTVGES